MKRIAKMSFIIIVLCLLTAMVVGCTPKLGSVVVKNNSMKAEYTVGDTLDITGGKLFLYYSDDSSKEIDIVASMITGFDSASAGEKCLQIRYEDMQTQFYYTVKAKDIVIATDYSYIVTTEGENGKLTVTGLEGEYPSNLYIPSTIGGKSVVAIGTKAFATANVSTIEIAEGIVTIGANAFFKNPNLDSVILPDSVTSIGDYAFWGSSSLETVHLGEGLKVLPLGLFYDCKTLVRVDIPSGLQEVGGVAFYMCPVLDEILLPDSVTKIGDRAFQGCSNLLEIDLKNVKEIAKSAFRYCTSLKNVDISGAENIANFAFQETALQEINFSSSLKTIGEEAFSQTGVEEVVFPASLEQFGIGAFSHCEKLASVKFENDAPNLKKIPGDVFGHCGVLSGIVLGINIETIEGAFINVGNSLAQNKYFDIDFSKATKLSTIGADTFANSKLKTTFEVPSTVTIIGGNAFMGTTIEEFSFAEGTKIEAMGNGIFQYSRYLKKAILASSFSEYDSSWFASSTIEELDLSKTAITQIKERAFTEGYENLEKVILPSNGLVEIGAKAFYMKRSLIAVENLQDVQAIKDEAFYGCSILELVLGGALTEIGNKAFQSTKLAGDLSLPLVTTIGSYAFKETKLAGNVTMPKVTKIGEKAFEVTAITKVIIGENINEIGISAFQNCKELTAVQLGASKLAKVGNFAFSGCQKMESFQFGVVEGNSPNTTFGSNVFYNCFALAEIILPSKLVSIGSNCFYGTKITNLVIPESVTTLPSFGLLSGCKLLKSVTISSGAKSMDSEMFSPCEALEEITILITDMTVFGEKTSLGWDELAKLTKIFVPAESVESYKTQFASKSGIIQAIAK